MKNLLFICIIFLSIACSQAQDRKDVERIVSTLADDKMQGRAAGTKGEEMAAEFIAGEFKKAGLSYFGNLKTYSQPFKLYTNKIVFDKLELNGKALEKGNSFATSNAPNISFQDVSKLKVFQVTVNDDFRGKMKEYFALNESAVVLINETHKELFEKYKAYFTRSQKTIADIDNKKQIVWLLTNETKVNEINIVAHNDADFTEMQNVIGVIPGKSKKNEYVVFSGHFDHIGIQKQAVNGDNIANGADDDASGTTAVIALAQYYAKQKNNERTLIFVAFTAEEIGGYGSQYFSSQINPDEVVAMVNIEMIGKKSKFGKNAAFITGFDMSDFGKILQKNSKGSNFNFHPDPYPEQQLFYRSDNATLAKLGVPAHTLSTDEIDIDEYYHTVDDEVETLDLDNMTAVIKAIPVAVSSIVAGKDTPARLPKKTD